MQDVWVTVLASVALLTRFGLALYTSGASRSKNAADAVVRTICDLSLAVLAFWAVGLAILHADASLLVGRGVISGAYVLMYAVIVLIATGAAIGVVAERTKFGVACASSLVLGGLVIPLLGYFAWTGPLQRLGFVDVAGSAVVHVAAGAWAAVAAAVVGPRGNKYNRDGSSNAIPGHSVVLLGAGVLALLVGWVPYVTGAGIVTSGGFAQAPANVLLSGAAGAVVALAWGRAKYGKTDLVLTCVGLLGGLVAITGAASSVGTGWAVLIGAVAGWLVPAAALMLDVRFRIDDPTSGVAIHLVGGLWGTLATGLLAPQPGGWLTGLAVQALGAAGFALVSGLVAAAVMFGLRAAVGVRSKEADEYDGLDLAEHDVNAYPDFQQTMIKSYHLREA